MRSSERIVAISGAARGIGLATAQAFAQTGARLILLDRDREALTESAAALDGATHAIVDCADAEAAAHILEETAGGLGGLDVLVNNAGRFVETPAGRPDVGAFESLFMLNAITPFVLARAAAVHMVARGGGAIINVSSVGAFYPREGQAAYCASKAALEHLSRVLALELAADRIRVNTIRPGYTDTDMGRDATAAPRLNAAIPLGAPARPEAIASGIVFLAQAEHMTGQVLCIDGGQTINFVRLVPTALEGSAA